MGVTALLLPYTVLGPLSDSDGAMGDPQFAQRQMVNTKTQFDYQPPGVDINLIMGIPAEVLLKKACDRFSRGFTHKLVNHLKTKPPIL